LRARLAQLREDLLTCRHGAKERRRAASAGPWSSGFGQHYEYAERRAGRLTKRFSVGLFLTRVRPRFALQLLRRVDLGRVYALVVIGLGEPLGDELLRDVRLIHRIHRLDRPALRGERLVPRR